MGSNPCQSQRASAVAVHSAPVSSSTIPAGYVGGRRPGRADRSSVVQAGAADTLRTTAKGTAAGGSLDLDLVSRAGRIGRLDLTLAAPSAAAWFGRADVAALARPARLQLSGTRVAEGTPAALRPALLALWGLTRRPVDTSGAELDPALRTVLEDVLREDTHRLRAHLGPDFDCWGL